MWYFAAANDGTAQASFIILVGVILAMLYGMGHAFPKQED